MDKIVNFLIHKELQRQQDCLEMIASENYVSNAVLESYSNVFTNKYSEGYAGKRYYGGQEYVDRLEILTQFRALAIFDLVQELPKDLIGRLSEDNEELKIIRDVLGSSKNVIECFERLILDEKVRICTLNKILDFLSPNWGVNVQPLSGSPANLAVYVGLLQPGDTILGMDLSAGGHLSHGHRLNVSGKFFNIVTYGVRKDNYLIDYDDILQKALEYKPRLIIAGYSAYPRDLNYKRFYEIAKEVEKLHGYRPILMADIAHIAGLIAGGVLSNDLWKYFDIITTTTHKTLRGPRGALIYFKKELESKINRGVFPGVQGGPHIHIIAAKAVAFGEILKNEKKKWKIYAKQVVRNAQILAEELIKKGRKVFTGGTDNHIVLIDVANSFPELNLDGRIAEKILENVGISVNKNIVPYDKNPPFRPSGIRLGTSAVTTRGLKEKEILEIADIIDKALKNLKNNEFLKELKNKVLEICKRYPLMYGKEKIVRVGIGVIVVKNKKYVLLGKRKSLHGVGTWSFPGGHIEFGEEIFDAAVREVKEEVGIKIDNLKILSVTNDIFNEEKHYITIFVLANYIDGEIKILEPDKFEEWRRFDRDNLPSPLFLPIKNLIKQGFKLNSC